METEKESICYKEMLEIEEERFQCKKCILEVGEFGNVCLNVVGLKTALIAYINDSKCSKINGTFDNKNMQFSSYKQYIWWIHNKLGKVCVGSSHHVSPVQYMTDTQTSMETMLGLKTGNDCIIVFISFDSPIIFNYILHPRGGYFDVSSSICFTFVNLVLFYAKFWFMTSELFSVKILKS